MLAQRRQTLTGLPHPHPPVAQNGTASHARHSERSRSAEHGVVAQPFTLKPKVSSPPFSNPSLKLKASSRALEASQARKQVLCLLPLCRHLTIYMCE